MQQFCRNQYAHYDWGAQIIVATELVLGSVLVSVRGLWVPIFKLLSSRVDILFITCLEIILGK